MQEVVTPRKRDRAAYMRGYRAVKAVERDGAWLLPFQQEFVDAVCRERDPVDIAMLSVPRGGGKSWLCGSLIARSLTPGDTLHEANVENILVSASRPQAAIVMDFARAALGEDADVRWKADGATHLATRARVRIISSDSRRALGLGASVRLIVADEPGAWGPVAGRRLWDAILTSLGKRRTTLCAIGTLAPAPLTGPASWWPQFVASGSGDGRHISLLQADHDLLLARIWEWSPAVIVSDPYRTQELHQVVAGRARITERARGGGESTSNVQSLRALLLDSNAGVSETSRDLIGSAFAQTNLVVDASGITKVTKSRSKRSRDDAAAALLLAAGELARRPAPVELRGAVISKEGRVTWL